MINASCKWLKIFLVSKVRKIGFLIALIFGIHVKFLDLLFLNKFTAVFLTLLSPSPTTLLSLVLKTFEAKFDNSIIFK